MAYATRVSAAPGTGRAVRGTGPTKCPSGQGLRRPGRRRSGSALNWVLPGIIGLALVVGLVQGAVLRARRPGAHARIGLGNEAFQLEKAADPAS